MSTDLLVRINELLVRKLKNVISLLVTSSFKIEEKYPKIGRIIQLRRKFQNYYLIKNILLIVITLLPIIYLNYNIYITFS